MVRSLQRATVKLLELAVLEPIPGPKPLLAVFLPQRRNYLRNSLQPFYCTDAVLQHHCLKQVPDLSRIAISALPMKWRSNAQAVTLKKVNETCCWLSQRRWSSTASLKVA